MPFPTPLRPPPSAAKAMLAVLSISMILAAGCGGSEGADPATAVSAIVTTPLPPTGTRDEKSVKALSVASGVCTFDGKTYSAGQTLWGYYKATIPYPNSCEQVRIGRPCAPGRVLPVNFYESCQQLASPDAPGGEIPPTQPSVPTSPEPVVSAPVEEPEGCAFGGQTYESGQTIWGFYRATINLPNSCRSVKIGRRCVPGQALPANFHATCSQVAASAPVSTKPTDPTIPDLPTAPNEPPDAPEETQSGSLQVLSDGPFKVLSRGGRIDVLSNDLLNGTKPTSGSSRLRVVDPGGLQGVAFDGDGFLVLPPSEDHRPHTVKYEVCELSSPTNCAQGNVTSTRFTVFDGTLYSGKPSGGLPGLTKLEALYSVAPGPSLPTDVHVAAKVKEALARGTDRIVMDAEAWVLMTNDPQKLQESVANYLAVVRRFKAAAPQIRWSLYSIAPAGDYYNATGQTGQHGLDLYRRVNDALRPVAEEVDALFPSVYTRFEDREMNDRFIIANIQEARRIGKNKPVYAFIWPQFSETGMYKDNRYLPTSYWRRVLELCKVHADGVVIWGGWDMTSGVRAASWDQGAPWWAETQRFLQGLQTVKQ